MSPPAPSVHRIILHEAHAVGSGHIHPCWALAGQPRHHGRRHRMWCPPHGVHATLLMSSWKAPMSPASGRRPETTVAVELRPPFAARVSGGRSVWPPPSAAAHVSGAHRMTTSRRASRRRPALLRHCSTARGQCRQVLRLPRRAATAATCGSSGHCATWWTGSRRGRAHSLQGPRGPFTWPWSENAVDSRQTK